MDRARFRRLVRHALDGLPHEVAAALDNIAVVIEREPSKADLEIAGVEPGDDLFGLYVGTPLPERAGGLSALPDRIVIYQGPLERGFHPRDIPGEIQKTVRHELAHYFGIDDDRLATIGMD